MTRSCSLPRSASPGHPTDVPPTVVQSTCALAELVQEGLARRIGLSEVGPATLRVAAQVHPIAALQSEYSLWSREPETDVLPACRELGVAFVAYGPLGKGFLAGALRSADDVDPRLAGLPRLQPDNLRQNLPLLDGLARVARRLGCTTAQLSLAWVMARGALPIPGSARRHHLAENLGALDVRLSEQDLAEIDQIVPHGAAAGARKPPDGLELTAP